MNQPLPVRIIPTVQHYPWGKKGRDSAIAPLVPQVNPETPYAELWIGSHPRASATIKTESGNTNSEQTLRSLIEADPRSLLGSAVADHFGELPFLLKMLSVAQPLSIQAHPSKTLAQQLHRQHPEHYPDANHKPEMGIALTPVEILYGFKNRPQILETFRRHPALMILMPRALTRELHGLSFELTDSQLCKAAYEAILLSTNESRGAVVDTLCTTLPELCPLSPFEQLIPNLRQTYGEGDCGILSGLLLNEITIPPGKALYIGPNIPHAYLSGDLIECMAASDNVVRAGLTPKYQDRETLLSMINYSETKPSLIEPRMRPDAPHMRYYEAPVSEFQLAVSDDLSTAIAYETGSRPEILFVMQGSLSIITTGNPPLVIRSGEGVFVPASIPSYRIQPNKCSFVRVTVPPVAS